MNPPIDIREQVPLAPHTTLGLGGPARWFCTANGVADLIGAIEWSRERRVPLWVLGGGSNVIVPDAGLDGLVLKLEMRGVEIDPERGASSLVRVEAGEPWEPLVATTVAAGLQGLECLSGIPGYTGATPIQNVGAYGQEVADTIVLVETLDRATLKRVEFSGTDCAFGYRMSRFKGSDRGRYIVTAVVFRLLPGAPPALRYPELRRAVEAGPGYASLSPVDALGAVRDTVLRLRRRKSMVVDPDDPESRSVGSFFMNPIVEEAAAERLKAEWAAAGGSGEVPAFPAGEGWTKLSAAWLVEQAGFTKGTVRSGVGVSRNHSLALVNRGGSAAALLALAEEIRGAVRERFGVDLEREPVVLGAD